MGRFIAIIILVIVLMIGILALFTRNIWTLRLWSAIATILVPIAFFGGLALGAVEARGKVQGIDIAMHTMGRTYDHATQMVARMESRRPQPTVQVLNAPQASLPPISRRQLTGGDETIDL